MEIYDRGLRLKTLRKKCGLSQAQVAKLLGVTRSTIGAYERNEKFPRVDTLERIAILYRSSVDYILGLDNRESIFLDDFTDSQKRVILSIVQLLREEWETEK